MENTKTTYKPRSLTKPKVMSHNLLLPVAKRETLVKPEVHYNKSKTLYDAFHDIYNDEMETKHRDTTNPKCKRHLSYSLRGLHKSVFHSILELVATDVTKQRRGNAAALNPNKAYTLIINKEYLATIAKVSSSAIGRHLNRLQEAGVLFRTTYRHYKEDGIIFSKMKLKINPSFLVFLDQKGKIDNQAINTQKDIKCALYCVLEQLEPNKKIKESGASRIKPEHSRERDKNKREQLKGASQIEQEHSQERDKNKLEHNKSIYENDAESDNKQKEEGGAQNHSQGTSADPYAFINDKTVTGIARKVAAAQLKFPRYNPTVNTEFELEKVMAMQFFFAYALQRIYHGRDIVDHEIIRAQEQLFNQFFSKPTNIRQLKKLVREFTYRIDYVHRFMEVRKNKGQLWQPPTPVFYFDENNNSKAAFNWTATRWDREEQRRIKNYDRQHAAEKKSIFNRLLAKMAEAYLNGSYLDKQAECLNYLSNNHPYWEKEFLSRLNHKTFKTRWVDNLQERINKANQMQEKLKPKRKQPSKDKIFEQLSEMYKECIQSGMKSYDSGAIVDRFILTNYPELANEWSEYTASVEWSKKYTVTE